MLLILKLTLMQAKADAEAVAAVAVATVEEVSQLLCISSSMLSLYYTVLIFLRECAAKHSYSVAYQHCYHTAFGLSSCNNSDL
jgi:hypothetical protein